MRLGQVGPELAEENITAPVEVRLTIACAITIGGDPPAGPGFDVLKSRVGQVVVSTVNLHVDQVCGVLEAADLPMFRHVPEPRHARWLVCRIGRSFARRDGRGDHG